LKQHKKTNRKLLRQLEDLSEQALTLNSEYLHRFKTLYAISSKLGRFCYEVYKKKKKKKKKKKTKYMLERAQH
jgi:dynactin 1